MTQDEARVLLLRFDGRIRHADRAGISIREEIALRLYASNTPDWMVARALRTSTSDARETLKAGQQRLLQWHRTQAKDILSVVSNRPLTEPLTYQDHHGEEQELILSGRAEDDKVRAHPNVRPDADELIRPVRQALSVLGSR